MARIDRGVVSPVAELRARERSGRRGKTGAEERKVIGASPAAMTLAAIFTTAELGSWRRRRGTGEGADRSLIDLQAPARAIGQAAASFPCRTRRTRPTAGRN